MAERRMFAKTIIDSDAFLDMPTSARLLYYDLSMRADDDGFINSPKKIIRMTGASDDDLKILIIKKFVIPFENGVVVIKHWLIHNYIRKDTYKETTYKEQKAMLTVDENKSYKLIEGNCIRTVDEPSTQDRIGKDRLDKDIVVVVEDDGRKSDFQKIMNFYQENIGLLTPNGIEVLEDYMKDFPEEVIIYAMKRADEANIRTMDYIRGILNNWQKAGVKSLIQAQQETENFKNKKSTSKSQTKQNNNTNAMEEFLNEYRWV